MLLTCRRRICEHFLVSVFNAVSGESLAELHHSGGRLVRADAASSSLFFLAVVLARSGQVLRWRLEQLPWVPRKLTGLGEHFVAMTKGQCSSTIRYHLYTARTFLLSWREWTWGPKWECVTLLYYVDIKDVGEETEAVGCVVLKRYSKRDMDRSTFARFMSEHFCIAK